jgi:tetratricopeptide (TPR) repeat protein
MAKLPKTSRSVAQTDLMQKPPADIAQIFDRLTDIAKHPYASSVDLKQRLAEVQKTLEQHQRAELSGPIDTWQDFKIRLAQMKAAAKRGDFDLHLERSWRAINTFLNSLTAQTRAAYEDEPEYWKARTLIHELNDVFKSDIDINEQVFVDGLRVVEELKNLSKNWDNHPQLRAARESKSFRVLAREKILFCSCYGNELKRRGDTEHAGKGLRWLLDFTERKVKTREMPCFGTRAVLSYGLATIFRNLEYHREAREYYTKALDLYFKRAKKRGPDDQDNVLFTTRRIAMCIGLGFGWINLTRGYLRRAENALTTARALLAQTPHSLVVDYIEFLYGNIKRCRAGSDKKQLDDAIASLKVARSAFQAQEHRRYEARAARELALAYNLTGEFEAALDLAQLTEEVAIQQDSLKGKVNACVLRSRILREQGKYKRALYEVERGLEMMTDNEEPVAKVDALIARGECRLYLAQETHQVDASYADARTDFESANEMLFIEDYDSGERQLRNPKIAAVCELRIAQCHAKEGNQREAEDHFSVFRGLRTRVEHEWVRELGRKVRSEIDKLTGNFVVPSNDPTLLKGFARIGELQRWIARQALNHSEGNVQEAADLVGVKRHTLTAWLKNSDPKRVRIGKNRGARAARKQNH